MHFALCALALVVRLVARRILVEAVEAVEAAADFLVLAPGALELQSSRSNRLSA